MESIVLKTIGKNIKKLRKLKGLTQEALAEQIEVHHTTIGRLEIGSINVSILNLEKIANALDIEVKDLFID